MASRTRFRHFLGPIFSNAALPSCSSYVSPSAKRMMRKFEMRRELAVDQQRCADARAQRDDELDASAADDLETLDVSVVGDPNRVTERVCHRTRQDRTPSMRRGASC